MHKKVINNIKDKATKPKETTKPIPFKLISKEGAKIINNKEKFGSKPIITEK
jgi:hypothetical protein